MSGPEEPSPPPGGVGAGSWSPEIEEQRAFGGGRPLFPREEERSRSPEPEARETPSFRGFSREMFEQQQRENDRLRQQLEDMLRRVPSITTESKMKNFTLRELTDKFSLYHSWRLATNGKILKSGLGPTETESFLKSIDRGSTSSLKTRPQDEHWAAVDGTLYSEIMDSLKSEGVAKHAKTIEREGQFGNGRLALKLLDREYRYTGDVRTAQAHDDLSARSCSSMDALSQFLSEFKYDRNILEDGEEPMGRHASYKYLTEKLRPNEDKGLTQTRATFAEWNARKHRGETPVMEELIASLTELGVEHDVDRQKQGRASGRAGITDEKTATQAKKQAKEEVEKRAKAMLAQEMKRLGYAAAPPAGGGKGGKWCKHCKAATHTDATCWKLHPEQAPNNQKGGGWGRPRLARPH
jgi:hypothetical protein